MATVLVVDDNPADRRLLVTLLGHRGHRTLEAENGTVGLESVRSGRPDLVVSDMIMPRMDGFEFARRVRSDPMTASTRVVFWTASTIDEKRSALARECGVEFILPKPSEPRDIIAAIDRALAAEPAPLPDLSAGFEREHLVLLTDALHEKVEALKAAEGEREQLARRTQMAERLESLGRLAGGVAHDFNNLLAVILNYADFAREGVEGLLDRLPEEERSGGREIVGDVWEITRAAQRAAALTHQLLIFGRREVVNPEVLDLNAVVSDLENLLRRTIGEHIEFKVRLGENLRRVRADPSGVEQVLMNVVVNARDAMAGGGTLVVETAEVEVSEEGSNTSTELAPGSYVRLSVSDSGDGMSPEVAARAFEPFFTTKPKGEGAGLGLATAYGIVSQAGGYVHLYSEPGVGTTVRVYWPGAEDGPSRPAKPSKRRAAGGGETVLLVEDENAVRESVRRVLAKNGYAVIVAGSGIDALALADAHDPQIHLLLTDVVMPGMPGKELVARFLSRSPSTRVLFMSGYPQDVLDHGAIEGGLPLIEKPFTAQELLHRMREILDDPTRGGGGEA